MHITPVFAARARRAAASSLLGLLVLLGGCAQAPVRRPAATPPPAPRVWPQVPPSNPAAANNILMRALGLVGTPYRYGGNTPAGGFDCSGLIGYVYRLRAGLVPPRTVAELSDFGTPIGADALRTGDLVVFGRGRPFHAGIYVGEGRFVHAPSTGGEVRLDRLRSPYWSRQATAFRRP